MEEKQAKKGTKSWEPWKTLQVTNRTPGMRPRWVYTDPANLEKKQAEGWAFVRDSSMTHDRPRHVDSGTGMGSMKQYRDLVLMQMPEDMVDARTEHYSEVTRSQTSGITKRLQDKMKSNGVGKVYGKVEINGQRID